MIPRTYKLEKNIQKMIWKIMKIQVLLGFPVAMWTPVDSCGALREPDAKDKTARVLAAGDGSRVSSKLIFFATNLRKTK